MQKQRYWKAKCKNKELSEIKDKWDVSEQYDEVKLVAEDITDSKGKPLIIKMPLNKELVQGKKATATFNKITITHRFLGFKIGSNIIKINLAENKPEISIDIE